ncbi:MAG TPA: hypothetical protein VK348_07920 [Planctomycetota bacterium]|nr:hypothetical protein [Planctomycetota bacterium]
MAIRTPMRTTRACLIAVATTALSCCSPDAAPAADVGTRFRAFEDRIRSIDSGATASPVDESDRDSPELTPKDRMLLGATVEFGRSLSDADLRAVPDLTSRSNEALLRWLVLRLLIDRRSFDDAARVVIADARANPSESSHRLWNWLQAGYGKRPDYRATALGLGDGLLRQFEAGPPEVKVAVAGLFGMAPADASLSVDAFKAAIGYGKR